MAGPVSEGSIVAYIGANDDDYQAKMRAAQATAEELGRTDPTVTVHANVGEALAKLEALQAAQIRLSNAEKEVTLAQRDLTLAQMTGQRVLEEKVPRVDAMVRASDRLSAAMARSAAATDEFRAATAALQDLAPGVPAPAEPTPTPTNTASNAGRGIGFAGAVGIGVAAVLPLLADLVGYIAAGTGAFMGMGAAGVFAFKGIKDEIASGSAQGQLFLQGTNLIKQDLSELASTAANSVAPGMEAAFGIIHNQLPDLNTELAGFGDGLARVATFTVDGLVTGFQVLNPLFRTAQSYIVGVAQEWDTWVHNGGLLQWGTDVQRVFPLVADTFGTLGHTVLTLIGDLAPLGTALFGILDGAAHVADFLATVLGPAFGPVTLAAVTAGILITKNWATIGPLFSMGAQAVMEFVGAQDAAAVSADALAASEATVQAAMGPIGWIGLAVAGVLAATSLAQGIGSATTAMQDFTSAVEQDKGVVGDATQAQLAKNLVTSDAIDKAKQLGISEQQVTDAITGGAGARSELLSSLNDIVAAHTHTAGAGKFASQSMDDEARAAKSLIATIKDQNASIDQSVSAYQRQAAVMGTLSVQANAQIESQQGLGLQFGLTTLQLMAAADEQQNLALQTSWVSTQLNVENTAAQNLSNELQLMNNGALSVAMAQTAQAAATNTLTDSFKKNGLAINGTSQAAIANQQALQAKIQADQQEAEAIAKSTGSQEAGTKALQDSKDALEAQLKKFGDLTPQVQAYIDKLYQIPSTIYTNIQVTTSGALASIHALQAAEQGLNYVATARTGNVLGHADGGPIYAATGMFVPQGTDTVPAMLTPGEFVIKEKSAGYDPQFLKSYNDDPARAMAAVRGQGRAPVNVTVQVTGTNQQDPHVLGSIVGTRTRRALAGIPGVNR